MGQKRGNGEGSIGQYRGRWISRMTLPDGKRKAIYGSTRAEVAQKLAAALRDRDAGIPALNEQTTVGSFLLQWLDKSVKVRNRPSTIRSYTGHVHVHLLPALGKKSLARLTPEDVETFMEDKLATGLTAATVNRIRSTLRRALAIAQKQGLVTRNAAGQADPPSVKPKHFETLTIDQARAFLDIIHGHRMEALFVVAITTGLRQGELLGLKWQDVDFAQRRLSILRAVQRVNGTLKMVETKTTRSRRTLALSPSALSQLQAESDRQQGKTNPDGSPWNPMGLVFPGPSGMPQDGGNVTRKFQKVLSDGGLPKIRFHDLRHTCASLLLAQGTNMRVIMEQLGHSQISLTMNTYSHVMMEALDDAASRMESILTGGKSAGT